MDAVDILQFAVDAARMIRNSPDPQFLFDEAWSRFAGAGQQPTGNLPWSVRIAQLAEAANERRSELYRFLRQLRGQCYLNRNNNLDEGSTVSESVMDPQAMALLQYLGSPAAEAEKVYLFLGDCAGPFEIGRRRFIHTLEAYVEDNNIEFPKTAVGLIDDPLERPVLFAIDFEEEGYWNLSEILEAFADQYHMIYENPRRFGVSGHDLSNLWIEQLKYYPSKKLIYPYIGT
jgi:hypothetical protein